MFKIETLKVKGSVAHFLTEIQDIMDMKYLGSGVNGRAFAVDKTEIIKVFYKDDAYQYFIKKLSKLKRENSFAPRINYVLKLKGDFETCYMVSMERLLGVYDLKGEKLKKFLEFQSFVSNYVDDFLKFPKKIIDPILPKELVEIIKIIETGTKKLGFSSDLHAGNVMVRANGDYVIIDPMVGDYD